MIYLLLKKRISWNEIKRNKSFMNAWEDWQNLQNVLFQCLNAEHIAEVPGLIRCKERLEDFAKIILFFNQDHSDKIRWLKCSKHTLVFHATPYTVAEPFSELLKRQLCTYVFTSATLTIANSFECFCNPLGLNEAKTLLLPSPFNYQQQALLYLPRGLPDPKNSAYYELLLERVLPIIKAFGGRCFFLFTSHKALKQVAQMMESRVSYPLLIQGSEAKSILLERLQLGNAVLLGTATFWEGVDVKGDALSCDY